MAVRGGGSKGAFISPLPLYALRLNCNGRCAEKTTPFVPPGDVGLAGGEGSKIWPPRDHRLGSRLGKAKSQVQPTTQAHTQAQPERHVGGRCRPAPAVAQARPSRGLRWAHMGPRSTLPRRGARRASTGGFGSLTRRSRCGDLAWGLVTNRGSDGRRPCRALVALETGIA